MEHEMPEHNVVSLNEYGKRRTPITDESQAILIECRDMLASGVARVLSGQAEAMENSLISLADRAPLMETRNLYFGAQGVLNHQGTDIFQACKQAFLKSFDEQTQSPETGRTSISADELSLVEDMDFESTLAVNKSSSRLRFHAHGCTDMQAANGFRRQPFGTADCLRIDSARSGIAWARS
jgi:hypothetical protein